MANKENVRKWVEALRSGEYQQTQGMLRDVDREGNAVGFCCLGVACDISGLGEWNGRQYVPTWGDASSSVLPDPVADWLGLNDDPVIEQAEACRDHDGCGMAATTANDSEGYDFAQIADALEQTYLQDAA